MFSVVRLPIKQKRVNFSHKTNKTKQNARLAMRQRADLFSFSVALALRKANFVSRNIGLK